MDFEVIEKTFRGLKERPLKAGSMIAGLGLITLFGVISSSWLSSYFSEKGKQYASEPATKKPAQPTENGQSNKLTPTEDKAKTNEKGSEPF